MSAGDGSVSELRGELARAMEEVGRLQSALSLAKDRAQQTRDIITRATEGSTRDETATARASLDGVDQIVDQAIEASMLAMEQIAAYLSSI